jgi:hypothetical protein
MASHVIIKLIAKVALGELYSCSLLEPVLARVEVVDEK